MVLGQVQVRGNEPMTEMKPRHEQCEDCLDWAACQECGGYMHSVGNCGDPDCSGADYNYCLDCGANE